MDLPRYLTRVYSLATSRQDVEVEYLYADETIPGREGTVEGRLRFWDNSLLEFVETLVVHGFLIVKTDYAYHYQDRHNQLVFRYDNAPHHPQIATFPHHKHWLDNQNRHEATMAATPPDLQAVLREIDEHLYPTN